jgi:hypothetical protein
MWCRQSNQHVHIAFALSQILDGVLPVLDGWTGLRFRSLCGLPVQGAQALGAGPVLLCRTAFGNVALGFSGAVLECARPGKPWSWKA